jgi:8-oxo-dGTP diphosphatase
MTEEWLDLYDWEGTPTGERALRSSPKQPDRFRLVIEVWMFNARGEVLMQQRSPHKKLLPGAWSPTTGCVQAGEDAVTGCLRELEEELGLKAAPEELELVEHRRSRELGTLCDVFFLFKGPSISQLRLQQEEVAQVCWMPVEEVEALIQAGRTYTYPGMVEHLYQGARRAKRK